jgi:hypothetical protein
VSSQEKTRNQVFSNADKGIGVPDLMFIQYQLCAERQNYEKRAASIPKLLSGNTSSSHLLTER